MAYIKSEGYTIGTKWEPIATGPINSTPPASEPTTCNPTEHAFIAVNITPTQESAAFRLFCAKCGEVRVLQ